MLKESVADFLLLMFEVGLPPILYENTRRTISVRLERLNHIDMLFRLLVISRFSHICY